MAKYFNYIPFPRKFAGEYLPGSWKLQWSTPTKLFTDIYFDDSGKPLQDLGDDTEVTIYVRGHGNAGSDEISNYSDFGTAYQFSTQASAAEVVQGLIDLGIEQNFCGKIKLYNCYSAVNGESAGAVGFAARIAAEFRDLGYLSAQFYGYTETISAMKGGNPAAIRRANELAAKISDAQAERAEQVHLGLPVHRNKYLDLLAKANETRKWTYIMGSYVRTSTLRRKV